MSIINKIIKIGVVVFLYGVMQVAHPAAEGFYMGLQLGYSNLNNKPQDVNTGLPTGTLLNGNGVPVCDPTLPDKTSCIFEETTPSNTGVGARLFLGANFNPYLGFEVGMANYTPSSYSPKTAGSHEPHILEYSGDIMLKGMYSVWGLGVFVKFGGALVYQSFSPALLPPGDEQKTGGSTFFTPAYGAGISYSVTPNWEVDFSANQIRRTQQLQTIDFYAVGLSYHWVKEFCGQFLC